MKLEDVRALAPADRLAMFETLARARYGSQYKTALAAEFETTRQAISRWVREENPPIPVIYALDAWATMDRIAAQLTER